MHGDHMTVAAPRCGLQAEADRAATRCTIPCGRRTKSPLNLPPKHLRSDPSNDFPPVLPCAPSTSAGFLRKLRQLGACRRAGRRERHPRATCRSPASFDFLLPPAGRNLPLPKPARSTILPSTRGNLARVGNNLSPLSTMVPSKSENIMASSFEPPIAGLLEQAARLRLTTEQKAQLNQLELDFEEKAARLLSEQQLLEVEFRRKNLSTGTPLSLTSEQLALIDEKMAELRLAWLGALETAIAVLSTAQQAKLRLNIDLMPKFDRTPRESDDSLGARITRIMSAQLKDSKVVEIETAQAIADRLLNWSKSFALAVGVPLTLGTFLLGAFGYQKYSDFTSTVSSAEQRALEQINKAAALTADEFEGRAIKVRQGYEKLESQLRETETLPAKIQELGNRLKHLEEIEIGGPTKISDLAKSALLESLEKYRDYMKQIGYQIPATKLNIKFDPEVAYNAYYTNIDNSIVMDPRLVGDPETVYHSYTHHVLNEINPKVWDAANSTGSALHEALSDYLPCSFEGASKFGINYVQTFAKELPTDM
jgi:hypothetical protein